MPGKHRAHNLREDELCKLLLTTTKEEKNHAAGILSWGALWAKGRL
jgi:hypothetical protein